MAKQVINAYAPKNKASKGKAKKKLNKRENKKKYVGQG